MPTPLALVDIDAGTERAVSWKESVDWNGSRKREKTRSLADMLELQGFDRELLDDCPFTQSGAKKAVGNGVPLPMGTVIAQAVISAIGEKNAVQNQGEKCGAGKTQEWLEKSQGA